MKGILVLLAAFALLGCQADWQKAEKAARSYGTKMGGMTSVSCAKMDSDGDGYCSCSVFLKGGKIQPLECGCEKFCLICTEGCKVAMPKMRTTNRR